MYIRTIIRPARESLRYGLGEPAPSSRDAEVRFKRVATLVTDGLKTAEAAIPQLSTKPHQAQLLRFLTSLLKEFFPIGHGLIDAKGNVLRQSQKWTVSIPITARDGTPWPFEHRIRIFLSDQTGFRASGEHLTGNFSSIRLYTKELHTGTPSDAIGTALHEMIHMMFAMIRRLEKWLGSIGAQAAARLLAQQPWRLLVLDGFAAHRATLERHLVDLLRVLPIPMQAPELAASLIEEAFAAQFEVIVDEAITRLTRARRRTSGPSILVNLGFQPKEFLKFYVLERGFAVTEKQLNSQQAQQIFQRMTSDVDALAASIRKHLDS